MANVNVLLDAERARSAELRDRVLKLSANLASVKRTLITGRKHSREERADSAAAERPPAKKPSPEPVLPGPFAAITPEPRKDARNPKKAMAPPRPKPHAPVTKVTLPNEVRERALQLQSILCDVKAQIRNPATDDDITWGSCAKMCLEEAEMVSKWGKYDAGAFYPNIKAAIQLVYPDKLEEWFRKKNLHIPVVAVRYWAKVLRIRAKI